MNLPQLSKKEFHIYQTSIPTTTAAQRELQAFI